jgi:hypothetical protein
MDMARMERRMRRRAESSEGRRTMQKGDCFRGLGTGWVIGREVETDLEAVGDDLKVDALEEGEGFDLGETEGLVRLGEADEVVHVDFSLPDLGDE